MHLKETFAFVVNAVLGGLLAVVPIYLAILLLKGMQSVGKLVQPFAQFLPEWMPAEQALSLPLALLICFLIGLAVRTRLGRVTRERLAGCWGQCRHSDTISALVSEDRMAN